MHNVTEESSKLEAVIFYRKMKL